MKPVGACCFWFLALAAALPAQPTAAGPPPPLRADHSAFLNDVATLILPAEREAFLALQRDYQRERFIVRFWQVRDPFPETARNEFREAWTARLELARSRYPDLEDGRARMLLINGEPGRVDKPLCRSLLKPIEIWTYQGTAVLRGEFTLLFVQEQGNPRGKYRLWHKTEGLPSLMEWGTSVGADYENSARRIASECHSGSDLLGAVAGSLDWGQVESKVELLPKPNLEWLTAFASRSTELPTDALPLPATLEVRFPARHQSRTVVEAMVAVEQSAATAGPAGGYGFLVDGEVLLQGELFESFRYRFDLPAGAAGGAAATLPMMLERYLRPGAYVLILRVTDVHGDRFFRAERPLEVPRVEATAAPQPELAAATPAAPAAPVAAPSAERATGDQTLKLFAPSNELRVGRVRVEATTAGEGIASVVFALNGKRVLAKSRPPWSVELDLGRAPRTHQLRAVALDAAGQEVASDELLLNAGPHSFRVRLVQPQRGQRYSSGLRAEAEVAVPMGDTLERVEFFLNEERVATLYQPPFVQPILLPSGQPLTYVRAVAYLADGNSAEALTFVNAPEYATEVKVDLVELYATVVDRRNRPIEGLERDDFTVFEDDRPQEILRFERVHDLPIRAAVVLDTSASMVEELRDATRAALRFFEEVVTPKDRAAIVTFADRPALVSPFTNNHEVLAGGVAALVADGETALWDAIVYTLHYFSGIRGKRAMVLLSDGEDVSSKYEYNEALDFARRTGVAIYTIGLNLPAKAVDARSKLTRLAEETGGRHFSIQNVSELERVYREIEEELRSQYLLAYQSPQDEPTRYRAVEVKVARPGHEAKTIRGYYP